MTNRTKGTLLMLIATLSFALMATTVKWTGNLPLMQKVFFRNAVALMVTLIISVKKGEPIKGHNRPFLLLRSILGFLGLLLYFFGLSNLYLADASILNNTSPFFVIVFSLFFLKEPIKKVQIPALILAFLGAGLVIKPQFNYSVIPSLLGLSSGMFAGGAYVVVRYLRKTDTPQTIIFYFSAVSVIISFPFLFMGHFIPPTPLQWVGLLAIGLFAAFGQFALTYAYGFAPAGELTIYKYAEILFTLMLGVILWSEVPDIFSMLGGVLIVGAGYLNYHYSQKEQDITSE